MGHLKTSTVRPVNLVTEMLLSGYRARSTHNVGALTKGRFTSQARWCEIHHVTQNGTRLKTYELFISGLFHLIFSDCT